MSEPETIADVAQRIGAEFAEQAIDAFEASCPSKEPPTKRERALIRVMSLQLASAIATVMANE